MSTVKVRDPGIFVSRVRFYFEVLAADEFMVFNPIRGSSLHRHFLTPTCVSGLIIFDPPPVDQEFEDFTVLFLQHLKIKLCPFPMNPSALQALKNLMESRPPLNEIQDIKCTSFKGLFVSLN